MDYTAEAAAFLKKMALFRTGMPGRLTHFSSGENFILNLLANHGETMLPSELSSVMRCSTARIATVLGNLEKKGLVTRDIDKVDRRKIIVTITDQGKEKALQAMRKMVGQIEHVFSEMGENDTKDFIRLMGRFLELSAPGHDEKVS